MVRQHGDPAAHGEGLHGARDRPLQDGQLAVDLDAQRLEGALGGVAAGALGGLRQRVPDELHEPRAVGERLLVALAHDGGHDPLGLLLLAVRAQDPHQLARGVGVEDLGGADAGRLVHAHVEGGVLGVGEAAVGLVELHGGDAEVEQHALYARDAESGQYLGQLVVDGVHQGGPLAEGGEPLAGQAQGLLVPVQGDQAGLGELLEEGLAVAAEAERAVDDDRSGRLEGGGQHVQAPLEHHRDMSTVAQGALSGPAGGTHRRVPARS